LDPRIQRTGKAYDAVVDSLTRLAQHLTGMRSGTGLQVELMNAQREGRITLDDGDDGEDEDEEGKEGWANGKEGGGAGGVRSPSWSPVGVGRERKKMRGRRGKATQTSDYFGSMGGVGAGVVGVGQVLGEEEAEEFDEEDRKLAEDANLFAEVREHVGSQLRGLTVSLVFPFARRVSIPPSSPFLPSLRPLFSAQPKLRNTSSFPLFSSASKIASTTTLLKIRSTFDPDPANRSSCDFDELREDLSAAHKAFQSASSGSILHLYGGGGDEKGEGVETAKGPKESVFLVF